jgi:hypothetical protein
MPRIETTSLGQEDIHSYQLSCFWSTKTLGILKGPSTAECRGLWIKWFGWLHRAKGGI